MLPHGCALTSEREASILASIAGGDTRYIAAGKAGISDRTFQRWMRKGRDNLDEVDRSEDEGGDVVELDRYGRFVLLVTQAEAGVRSRVLKRITRDSDWRAAAWFLERTDARNFGKLAKIEEVARDDSGEERSAVALLMERLDAMDARDDAFRAATTGDDGSSGA